MTPTQLKALRKKHKLYQHELAYLVGYSTDSIKKMEGGNMEISVKFKNSLNGALTNKK